MSSKYVTRFNKETAPSGHGGTILAGRVLPEGLKAPFGAAWGYLEGKSAMEAHAHPTEEIYIVYSGAGFVVVGDEKQAVLPGDVIYIPPNERHTMIAQENGTFLWAAFWWECV